MLGETERTRRRKTSTLKAAKKEKVQDEKEKSPTVNQNLSHTFPGSAAEKSLRSQAARLPSSNKTRCQLPMFAA